MDITKSDKHCVLIADDNPENLDVLSNILEEDGYRVRTSRNGKLALESIETSPVDLVLADIHMPEMDGYELCKKLKANPVTKDIPVIFVSAIDESFNKVIAFELGGVDYLTKPVEPKEVQARVRTHLKIQSLQNELRQHNESLEQMVDERNQKLKDAIDQLKDMNVRLQKLDQAKSDF
ncbi:MAG: response regulator, partial [Opitutales bacterium]|nr:response regulator [Opitutales bacterium]